MPEILKKAQFFQPTNAVCQACSTNLLVTQSDLFKVREGSDLRAAWECPVCQTRHPVALAAEHVMLVAERAPRMRAELA